MPRYKDSEIADALRRSRGMTYVAANNLGCSWVTIDTRLKKSAKLRAVRDEARGYVLDQAETKLSDAVEAGDPWAVKYLLSTLGRDRGYTEKSITELHGKGGGPVEIVVRRET